MALLLKLSALLPIFLSVASRARNSLGLASAKTFLISAACLRKIGAISSLPFGVSETTRTRRSSGLSTRLAKSLSTRRSTAVLIDPGVRFTFGSIVFTGKPKALCLAVLPVFGSRYRRFLFPQALHRDISRLRGRPSSIPTNSESGLASFCP